jgi:hypothetical protein
MLSKEGLQNDLPSSASFPLITWGSVWFAGCGRPIRWAIDARGQCFRDEARGGALCPVPDSDLLGLLDAAGVDEIRKLLGYKLKLPDWAITALQQGWTPPATFRREDFE